MLFPKKILRINVTQILRERNRANDKLPPYLHKKSKNTQYTLLVRKKL